MKSLVRSLVASLAIFAAASAFAQSAALSSDTTTLAPSGGTVVLTATTTYDAAPGALGWSIALPAEWTLVSVSGPDVPAISPQAGSSGTLEFAFTAVPAGRAEFTVQVRYPANAESAQATPKVLVRAGGKLTTLTPAPVDLRGKTVVGQRSRN
jgi:hypothetical protein